MGSQFAVREQLVVEYFIFKYYITHRTTLKLEIEKLTSLTVVAYLRRSWENVVFLSEIKNFFFSYEKNKK